MLKTDPYLVSELIFLIGAKGRSVRIRFRTEIAQNHERLDVGGVYEGNASAGGILRAEYLVFGQFVETNQFRAIQGQFVHSAFALDGDEPIGPGIFNRTNN